MDEQGWDRLVAVEPVVRRVLRKRVNPSSLDDLVQETLERLSGRVGDLSADQLASYAATCAINAAATFHRTNARHQRLQPGLIDLSGHDGFDTELVASEEASTLRLALDDMDPSDRELLEAHHVEETSVASLARRTGRSEMAVRLSLARARAKLRVDYTLAHQRVVPPTQRCRSVLLALSSGDRRAQQRLDADEHLEHCSTCSDLVAPATGRHRPAVGLLALLAWWWKGLAAAARHGISVGVAASAATAVAVVAVVTVSRSGDAAPQATAGPTTTVTAAAAPVTTVAAPPTTAPGKVRSDAGPVPSSATGLQAATNQRVTATSATVTEVPADEGFWIQTDDGGTVWVQLVNTGAESPVQVTADSPVTFTGTLVAQDAAFVQGSGLTGTGADRLAAQGRHIEVRASEIRVG